MAITNVFEPEKLINEFIEDEIISKNSSPEIQVLAIRIYQLLDNQEIKVPKEIGKLSNIRDKGIKEVRFGSGSGKPTDFRIYSADFEGSKYEFAIHMYARHNGCCLAVAMPKEDGVFHNVIQLVLDLFVSFEEDSVWVYHNGNIGGKVIKQDVTLDHLENIGFDIVKFKKRRLLNLGRIAKENALTWADVNNQNFFENLLVYCIHRDVIKRRCKLPRF